MQTNKAGNGMSGARWWMTLAAVTGLATAAGAADFSGWAKKLPITVAGYSKNDTLTNFPVLVRLNTGITGFSYGDVVSPNGNDLRFSDATLTNELNYEIDTWNSSGTSLVWVQVPALASNATIYAFYGNGTIAGSPAYYTTNGATWGKTYIGVWHFNQTNGVANLNDSSTNHWISTNYNGSSVINGANCSSNVAACIGNGQDISLGGNYQNCILTGARDGVLVPTAVSPVSFSYWCKLRGNAGMDGRPVNLHRNGGAWGTLINNSFDPNPIQNMQVNFNDGSGLKSALWNKPPALSQWFHAVTTYDGTQARLYTNGTYVMTTLGTGNGYLGYAGDPGLCMSIGNTSPGAGGYVDGLLDEVRVSTSTLSSNWVWACYQDEVAGSTFLAYGAAASQNASAPSVATAAASNLLGTSATLNGSLISTGSSPTTVTLYWGTSNGGSAPGAWAVTNGLGVLPVGAFATNLTGLAYGTTYWYNFSAVNGGAPVWGSPVSFTTLGPPSIGTGSVSPLTPVSATLNVTLTSTGAAATTVTCWFGMSAGSLSQVDSWPATTQPQTFTHTQNGLTPGTPYYYAFQAQNTTPDTTTWTVWTATNSFTTPATYVWVGGGGNNNWSTGPNWDNGVAPVNDGTAKVTISGSTRPTPVVDTNWNMQSLAFVNVGTAFAMSGSNLTLQAGGLSNNNSTAGRTVTISNNIAMAAAQTWYTGGNGNGVTVLNGNLTGSSGSTLTTYGNNSNSGVDPELQLGGTNSGFAGNLSVTPNSGGVLLRKPSAMIGGFIDLNHYDQTVYIDGTAGTYTFGIGNAAGQVNFRTGGGGNGGGLYLTGGPATWDPGNGGNYIWSTSGNEINLGGCDSAYPNSMLSFGNTYSSLIFSGAGKTFSSSKGNSPANGQITTILSALSDDGTARNLTSSALLLILTRPVDSRSGAANLGGQTIISGGGLSVSAANQIFSGNLNLSGGALILNNLSWAAFAAGRTYGTGANQWQISGNTAGFAARGTMASLTGTTSDFDRSFSLGAGGAYTNGLLYANAPVDLAQNTTLTGRRFVMVSVHQGPGFAPATTTSVVHRISGSMSGSGTLSLAGYRYSSYNAISEVVLTGTNTWAGNPFASINGAGFNAGPGGMLAAATTVNDDNGDCFVRFDGTNSIPHGAATTAYIAGCKRYDVNGMFGYLLTAGTAGKTYTLPSNYKFVLGQYNGSESGNNGAGAFGCAGTGAATLQSATIAVNSFGGAASDNANMGFMVREGQLTLGTPGNPVTITPTWSGSDTDKGVGSGPATTLADRTGASTLYKYGDGTVILGNLAFTKVDGSGDTSSQFTTWVLGRGKSGNSGATTYFDGAVRGVPGGNAGNSLQNATIRFRGGVYELDVSASNAVFNATVGTAAGNICWRMGDENDNGGGGFAAYSSVPGHRAIVDLNTNGVRDTLLFARNSTGNEVYPGAGDSIGYYFSNPFILGSRTANAVLEFYDNIDFNTRIFPIRVIDNTNSTSDRAVMTGTLQNGGLVKEGDGVLELAGSNTYANVTWVTNGTLLVNSSLPAGGAAVTVFSGGTLGGTGVIARAVTVNSGGCLSPGDQGIGTLTVSNLTLNAGAQMAFDLSTPSASDKVIVQGNLTLAGNLTATNATGTISGGRFPIFTYTGTLTDNGFAVTIGQKGASATIEEDTVAKTVCLRVSTASGSAVFFR